MGRESLLGSWAFLVGIIVAVIVGIFGLLEQGYMYREVFATILAVAGLLVGLLNVKGVEVQPFLMAGAVLIISAYAGQDVLAFMPWLRDVLNAILIMFVPATIVVAIRHVFVLAEH